MDTTYMLDEALWKFRDIHFDEGPHLYTDPYGTSYTSVTTFLKAFSPPKDWDNITEAYAKSHGLTVAQAKAQFSMAATRGTQIHAYMENLWKRKHYTPDDPKPGYADLEKSALTAFNALSRRFVPVREEFIVYDREWAICGTIDLLAWDRANSSLAILDYKTNKEIRKGNQYATCTGPLEGLPDCEHVTYSAQLSTYKLLLEKGAGLKVGEMALVHIRPDGYEYIPCVDYSDRIREWLCGRSS